MIKYVLYPWELEKDIIVCNFHNTEEMKIALQQKEMKNDNPKQIQRNC